MALIKKALRADLQSWRLVRSLRGTSLLGVGCLKRILENIIFYPFGTGCYYQAPILLFAKDWIACSANKESTATGEY